MSQNINLLAQLPSAPKQYVIGFLSGLIILIFVAVLLIVTSFGWGSLSVNKVQRRQLIDKSNMLNKQLLIINAKIKTQQKLLATLGEVVPENGVTVAQRELAKLVTHREKSGFSDDLLSLAYTVPNGVWLEHIVLSHTGERISLTGQALESVLVMKFLDNLRNKQGLSGKTLEVLRISKQKQFVKFTIENGAK